MKKQRTIKKIFLPTTFTLEERVENNTFDLNYYFWSRIISKEYLQRLFSIYRETMQMSPGIQASMNYILENLSMIVDITKHANYKNEPLIWYYSHLYIFILDIINSMNQGMIISLGYGIIPLFAIKDYHNYLANVDNPLLDMLGNSFRDDFFSNDTDYIIQLKTEYDLFIIFFISKYLKEGNNGNRVIVDLRKADEQNNYNEYIDNENLYDFIDEFIPMGAHRYKNGKYDFKIQKSESSSSIALRFFETKCYWNKCTFCTINNRYQSNKTFDHVNSFVKTRIKEIIGIIEKNNFKYISFTDEAIAFSILVCFAQELISRGIVCKWSVRARLDTSYSIDVCNQLGSAGLDTIGFGLESASSRISKLMNKRSEEYSVEQIYKILSNLDSTGISTHLFFIIGFPSETKKETDATLNFIRYLHENLQRFSFTANVFSLMKGSMIENKPESFGIVIENNEDKIGNIQYRDLNPGEKYSLLELRELQKEMRCIYFYKSTDTQKKKDIAFKYWEYLSQSSLFFKIKESKSNARFYDRKKNIEVSESVLCSCYGLIKPLVFPDSKTFYNIITDDFFTPDITIYQNGVNFLTCYDPQCTLYINMTNSIKDNGAVDDIEFLQFIKYLLDGSLLYNIV